MKILITGFEPFGESPINPSQELVKSLPDTLFGDVQLSKVILPVDQAQAPAALLSHIRAVNPDAVISFGLAAGRAKISLERIAVNLMDFRIADNNGVLISDKPVVEDGPAAYFSTLPIREILSALAAEGIPVELSLSAGSYLCNQVFYRLLYEIEVNQMPIRAGFIHLPALPGQAAAKSSPIPSMSLGLMKTAARLVIAQLLATQKVEAFINQ